MAFYVLSTGRARAARFPGLWTLYSILHCCAPPASESEVGSSASECTDPRERGLRLISVLHPCLNSHPSEGWDLRDWEISGLLEGRGGPAPM